MAMYALTLFLPRETVVTQKRPYPASGQMEARTTHILCRGFHPKMHGQLWLLSICPN